MHRKLRAVRCRKILNKFKSKTFVVLDQIGIVGPRIHSHITQAFLPAVINSPRKNLSEQSPSLECRINYNAMKINRICLVAITPYDLVGIANTEHNCDLIINADLVMVASIDVVGDSILVVVTPIGIAMLCLIVN